MPQTQTAQEVLAQPGFWDKPEKDQIEALGSTSQKFKGSDPEVQRKVLQTFREKFGTKSTSAAPPADPSNIGPPKVNAQSAPKKDMLKGEPTGGGLMSPLLEFARPGVEKVAGFAGGIVPKLAGAPAGVSAFSSGFSKGIADVGIEMSSPVNIGLGAAMLLPEAWLTKIKEVPKAAKLLGLIQKGAKVGFTAEMAGDLIAEVPEAAAAYKKGDYDAFGKAVAKGLADIVLIKTATAKKKAPPGERPIRETPGEIKHGTDKFAGRDVELRERTDTALAEKAVAARKVKEGKPAPPPVANEPTTPEGIEKRIGELQDQINHMARGTAEDNARYDQVEGEIRRLQSQHPNYTPSGNAPGQDPFFKGKRPMRQDPVKHQVAAVDPPPVEQTPDAIKKRAEEAKARAAAPRKPVGDLGYRVAPEETGELERRKPPISKDVKSTPGQPPEPPATSKPESVIPDGTQPGAGSAMEGQQFIAERLPGVPKGSKVIFREVTSKGTVIDIVDANGRTTQATLPYRDPVKNMEGKGWIKAVKNPVETFESGKPAPPPAPPPDPPVEERRADTRAQRGLPAPGGGTPVPGAFEFPPPEQIGKNELQKIIDNRKSGADRPEPKLLPGPPDPSGPIPQGEIPFEQQVEMAKGQPPEVIQNFIAKMQDDFLKKLHGVDIGSLPPEQKSSVMKAFQSMQQYLEPFKALLPEGEKSAGVPDGPPQPPAAPAPEAKGTGKPEKKSPIPPKKTDKPIASPKKDIDIRLSKPNPKPVKPPVAGKPPAQPPTPPAESGSGELANAITQGMASVPGGAKSVKYIHIEVPGTTTKWTKPIAGEADLPVQIADLVRQAKAQGYTAITITPQNSMRKSINGVEPTTFQIGN